MKIILEQDGVKREISGEFRICISRQDALELVRQLAPATHEEFHFGWMDIRAPLPSTSDVAPKKWSE